MLHGRSALRGAARVEFFGPDPRTGTGRIRRRGEAVIYGLYLSATGVLSNSYRQDVIANNLANAETVGFKKDLALFQKRLTEAQYRGLSARNHSNPLLEPLGGGHLPAPTFVDQSQGDLEQTENPLDLGIHGEGFFAVRSKDQTMLTRDGRFFVNPNGYLARSANGEEVLDSNFQPIVLDRNRPVVIDREGTITQNGEPVARLGVFSVQDTKTLTKRGEGLFDAPEGRLLRPATGSVQPGFVERSNVDPTEELASLMDTQRHLEANANMIRYQDQMLARLVNDVAKIS